MYHHKLGSLPSLSLLFSFVVVFTVTPVKANRVCWSTDCVTGDDWCIQTCSLDHDEFSCLALYRRNTAGENVASFFGCHNNPCDKECDPLPVEGVASNFACCCSGDLCNVVPGLTPTGDEPTAPPNPESPPTANPHDGMYMLMYMCIVLLCVCVCVCACACACACVCACVRACVHVYMRVYMRVHVHVLVCACVRVCVTTCIYMYYCVSVYIV